MSQSTSNHSVWRISLDAETALARLRTRVSPPRFASTAYGDFTTDLGIVGAFRRNSFDLRLQRFMASAGAIHAFGSVQNEAGGSRVNVRFGRATWITWLRRIFVVYMLLLALLGLIVGLHQPVFLAGTLFVTVIAIVVLWSMRLRREDVAVLRSFLEETYADVQLPPA